MKAKDIILASVFHWLSRIDEPFYSLLNSLANRIFLWRQPERIVNLGPLNRDKIFYVIGGFSAGVGLAGWYDWALGYIARAEKHNWIPVIDCPVNEFGQSWELYFDKVSPFSMSDVRRSSNVIFANPHLAMVYKRFSGSNIKLRNRLGCKYVRLQSDVQDFVSLKLDSVILHEGMVGAYLRGTDYRASGQWRPVGHSRVPDVETFVQYLRAACTKWGVDIGGGRNLFFVTEEHELLDGLLKLFPKASYVKKERFVRFKHGVCLPQQTLPHTSREENNRLYLVDIYALSKCDYLIGPMNGGMQMALNLNGGQYKGVEIIDLGTY